MTNYFRDYEFYYLIPFKMQPASCSSPTIVYTKDHVVYSRRQPKQNIQTIPGNNYKIVLKNAEDGLIRLMCDCKMYFLFPCYYSYCFPPIFTFFLKNRRLIMLENQEKTKSLLSLTSS